MDACRVSGALGEPLQGGDEMSAFVGVERSEDLVLVLVGDPAGAGEQGACCVGQVDGVGAAVGGVSPTFDQPAMLKVVEKSDHDLAVDAEHVGELLLGASFAALKVHEQPEVIRCDAQRRQSRCEGLRGVEPELGEQEVGSAGQRPVRAGCEIISHPIIVRLPDCRVR
ncbi:hypothetical protein GCM10009541_08800 [Micromonospora gifhornensis]|uniref:Uncharacterized protein n=1 Tax=Micromonospora gifhornensis TaxID=84594 RepID=A0ABQ4IBD8_9ACTN|nr:hypothetical protein Vgi01_19200 [Micromonospora gifhornensis]